ncbi:MAG: ATP-binding cassette domain-containing protein [Pseudomonadota bacterium]
MLTLEGLRFERGSFALTANWALEPGARVAVIGPSGGGKSTLLSLVAGFDNPTEGRVLMDGVDQVDAAPGERPMSILFQEGNLFPHLTVEQNVGLGLDTRLKLSAADKSQVRQVLRQVGLVDFERRKPGALSGGQRARTALARVLLRARPLLLLDEAFSALGPALKDEMFGLLEATIVAETTVLMVTHDPSEAARMDQIIAVDEGVAAAPAASGPLLADPPPMLRAYLGQR